MDIRYIKILLHLYAPAIGFGLMAGHQYRALVPHNMIGLVAFNLVLRRILGGMTYTVRSDK